MVELSTLQAVREIVTIVGVIAGLSYYFLTVQNANKARKIQLLHDITEFFIEGHSNLPYYKMMAMEWDNYDDFISKYGWEKDLAFYDEWIRLWRNMNYTGLLMKDGLVDASDFVHIIGDHSPLFWSKFKDIIGEMRTRYDNPELYIGIEFLASEVDKYRISKGLKPKASTNQ
jgi:hypothetical protein